MPSTPSLLAAFVSPGLFFGGAAAVAAPILIHLLARRRFRRIRWAAMDFLIHAERRNRRRLRMEEWILLALRCMAVAFIAAMVARPFFKPAGLAMLWGGSQHTERVFVLDDSFSMAYESAGGTVFDRAKLAVRRLVEGIRREKPDDTVTILRASAPSSPVESGIYLSDVQTEELLARLDALAPSQRSIDPATVVEGVVEMLEDNPDITNAAVYIISDFQRHDWVRVGGPGESPTSEEVGHPAVRDSARAPDRSGFHSARGSGAQARSPSILAPLAAWAGDDRGQQTVLINVGVDDARNLAVGELSLEGGQLVAGATGTIRAKVGNYASRSVENLELELTVGNLAQPSKTLRELGPQQTVSVDLEAEFVRAGFEAVRVELAPDALPVDNVRYAAAQVVSAIRTLIVNGEPSADSFDDEVTFLTTAMRPEGEVFSGNEVVVVDETGFEDANLAGFHVVVLANVYRLSDPAIELLEQFVRQGGGLLFFLGDQVDADLYNAAFYRDGEGVLPAELTEVIRGPGVSHLIVADRLHSVMRGLSSEGDPLGISQIAFFEYFGCVPFDVTTDDSIDDSGRGSSDSSDNVEARRNPPGRVIARFDDPDEHPAMVERRFGRGRVVLITTAADKEWHQWPDHPTFLPVMMELVRHVAHQGRTGVHHWVGDTIELPLDPAVFEPDAVVRTPAYPNEREVGLTAAPAGDGRGLRLSWEHTDTAGMYQFVLPRHEGGETVRLVAVNVDPQESDLAMAEEDELRQAISDVPFDYVKGVDRLTGAAGGARTELWRLFLLAAAAVLLTEQSLAWWWGRRR
ncbi:MAG: BatA domain-containing protein [Phycisphaerales bacterium]|nr:MAG: BatA domain-containing protein [Phycisphaerales bacterium]